MTNQLKKIKRYWKKIKENWRDMRWWKHQYRDRIFIKLASEKNRGIYILDEDWDSLIILDGCRYDLFEELNTLDGKLEWRASRGSCTRDFLLENFKKYPNQQKLQEIVYVTANPLINLYLPGAFYKIYSTWDYGWDESLNTVPPENVVKDALFAKEDDPEKRLIVHFVQPHCPFIGTNLTPEVTKDSARAFLLGRVLPKPQEDIAVNQPSFLIELGRLKKEEVWEAYKQNLKIVLPFVRQLVEKLSGKTVVTSDHGEIFGEKVPHFLYPCKEYGHPCGLTMVEELVKVPWFLAKK